MREHDDGQPPAGPAWWSARVPGGERCQGVQVAEPGVGEERPKGVGRHPGHHRVAPGVPRGVPDGCHQLPEVPWAREGVRA